MAIFDSARLRAAANLPVTVLVTLLLLVLTDVVVHRWNTLPERLPEHFSSRYLERYVDQVKNKNDILLVVGDSVLWGYGVSGADSAVGRLRREFPKLIIVNLAYEAGSPINVDFLLRYLLAHNLRPRAVLFDLNPISFNQTTAPYATLNAALERVCVPGLMQRFDRDKLNVAQRAAEPESLSGRVDRFLETHWLLYGLRVDVHQALFGDADAASALWTRVASTGLIKPHAIRNQDEPYAQMYDLTPLTEQNVSYAYTEHSVKMLRAHHIPMLGFLTPTNHALVHTYVDVSAYDDNLRRLQHLGQRYGVTILNFDRLLAKPSFIDNTHLTPAGNHKLAEALSPAIARELHVF